MKKIQIGGDLIVEETEEFDVKKIFDCGQAFRFTCDENGIIKGVAHGRVLEMSCEDNILRINDCSSSEFEEIWHRYFAFDEDYVAIVKLINSDECMDSAIKRGRGIRLLKQDAWETMVSFILSQNSNIPRIRNMVESLCSRCGERILYKGEEHRAFPSPKNILDCGRDSLSSLRLGYRDEYVYAAAKAVYEGDILFEAFADMDFQSARGKLMSVKGIGGKVADCILLFAMSRYEACPHDVWIRRIFSEKYNIENITEQKGYAFASEKWGRYAGIAQQFLFYAEREYNLKKWR